LTACSAARFSACDVWGDLREICVEKLWKTSAKSWKNIGKSWEIMGEYKGRYDFGVELSMFGTQTANFSKLLTSEQQSFRTSSV